MSDDPSDDNTDYLPVDLLPWEKPHGETLRRDRDIETDPYDRQERRVVNYLWAAGTGGGDDPVGSLIASSVYRAAELREARGEIERLRMVADSERAAIVAWLRAKATDTRYSQFILDREAQAGAVYSLADAIDRGQHKRVAPGTEGE